MRSIFAGIIVLSASTAVVHAAQAEKHAYMQAVIGHRQQSRQARTRLLALTRSTPGKTI